MILEGDPDRILAAILTAAKAVAAEPDFETATAPTARAEGRPAPADGPVRPGRRLGLDQVTGALTRFADASLKAALAQAVRQEVDRGALTHVARVRTVPRPASSASPWASTARSS